MGKLRSVLRKGLLSHLDRGYLQTDSFSIESDFCTGNHYSAEEFKTEILDRCLTLAEKQRINLRNHCMHGENLSRFDILESIPFDGCNLHHAIMSGLRLPGCSFNGCDLRRADFFGADLTGVSLRSADLREASLEGANLTEADLYGAKLLGANLRHVRLYRTRLHRESLGNRIAEEERGKYYYASAHDIYLRLKENFRSLGAYDAASWAYVRERVVERRSFAPWAAGIVYGDQYELSSTSLLRKVRFHVRYLLKYIGAWIQELSWGYGQKPERTIFICIVIIIGFAFFYSISGGIVYEGQTSLSIGDYLIYSLASFAVSSVPNMVPTTKMAQILTSLEGILGVATLALFTAALAQRMGHG